MSATEPAPPASLAGRVKLGGAVSVNRLGFGAMRLPGIRDRPEDPEDRVACSARRSNSESTSSTPRTPMDPRRASG
jgi:hypothetical protein